MKNALLFCSVFLLLAHPPARAQWNWDPAVNTVISPNEISNPIVKETADSLIFFYFDTGNMAIQRTSFSKSGFVGVRRAIAPLYPMNGALIDGDSVIINPYIYADSLVLESYDISGDLINSVKSIPFQKNWNEYFYGTGVYFPQFKKTVLALQGGEINASFEDIQNYLLVFDSLFQKTDSIYLHGYNSLGSYMLGEIHDFAVFGPDGVFKYVESTSFSGHCQSIGTFSVQDDTAFAPNVYCPDISNSYDTYSISGKRIAIKYESGNSCIEHVHELNELGPGNAPEYTLDVTQINCGKGAFPLFLSFPQGDHHMQLSKPYKVHLVDTNNNVTIHQMWGDTVTGLGSPFRINECDRQFLIRYQGIGNYYLFEYLPDTYELRSLRPLILNTNLDYRSNMRRDDFQWNGQWYKLIHWNEDNSGKRVGVALDCNGETLELIKTVENGVHIFPNPTRSDVHIKSQRPVDFQLINLVGELIREGSTDGELKLHVGDLPTGTYFLQWTDETGQTGVEKIIKL